MKCCAHAHALLPTGEVGGSNAHRADDREGNHPACTSLGFLRRGRLGTPGQAAKLYPCAARGAAPISDLLFRARNPACDFWRVRREIIFEKIQRAKGGEGKFGFGDATDSPMDVLILCGQVWPPGVDGIRDTRPRVPNSRRPLPFYCRATCPLSKLCRMLLPRSFQHKLFVTLTIAWQFSYSLVQGWYGRAGLEKPFHRKRKASIALSFQTIVAIDLSTVEVQFLLISDSGVKKN